MSDLVSVNLREGVPDTIHKSCCFGHLFVVISGLRLAESAIPGAITALIYDKMVTQQPHF